MRLLCLILLFAVAAARTIITSRQKRQIYRGFIDSLRPEEAPLVLAAGTQYFRQMGRLNSWLPDDPYTPAYRVDQTDTYYLNWYKPIPVWRLRPQVGRGLVNDELFINNLAAGNVPNAPGNLQNLANPIRQGPITLAGGLPSLGNLGSLGKKRRKRQATPAATQYNPQCLRHFRGPYPHAQYVNGVFVDACDQPIPAEYILGARVDREQEDIFGPLVRQQAGFDFQGNPIPQPEIIPKLVRTPPSGGFRNVPNPFDQIPLKRPASGVDSSLGKRTPGVNAQSLTTLLNLLADPGTRQIDVSSFKVPGLGRK